MSLTFSSCMLSLVICCARIVDVSLGTLRTVAVVRGQVMEASALGFFEILIWVLAISKVMTTLDNPLNVIGYAAGFALGNAVGILIEQKLAFAGRVMVSESPGTAWLISPRMASSLRPILVWTRICSSLGQVAFSPSSIRSTISSADRSASRRIGLKISLPGRILTSPM